MKTQDAIDHFGSLAALASALDVTSSAICQWGEYPPDKRQLQLERVAPPLKAEPECMARALGLPLQRHDDRKDAKANA